MDDRKNRTLERRKGVELAETVCIDGEIQFARANGCAI